MFYYYNTLGREKGQDSSEAKQREKIEGFNHSRRILQERRMSYEREKLFYCLVGLCCSGGWTPRWPGRGCACCSIQLEARFSASCISSRSPGSRQLCRQGERKDEGRGRHHGLSGWPAWPGKRLHRGGQVGL